ncbi:TPA: hypothetical protein DCR49_07065 [Candidatus Delongbacteria bacterium]|nr:MAG: hypothetical protein A2Y39_06290 [Candidatus Delongbacteria bacterium GWF2_40_14]HAQ61740.1 hypothetical protein [Candidatus Delongbacteria bacterium]
MKKITIAALFAIIYQAYALFGIGGHIGVDNTSVDAKTVDAFSITMSGLDYSYSLERDEIKNPLAIGAQIYFDIPIVPIGFELGFEGAWATYSWKGSNHITGPSGDIPLEFTGYDYPAEEYDEQFDFAKIGVDVTAKWYVFSLPPVVKTFKFYVGGGAGFYFITPIVSEKLIEKELEKKYPELSTPPAAGNPITFDVDEYIEEVTVIGYHFVAGMQLKLPALPIAFNVDYKYVSTPENDYGDPTNDFSVIKGSLSFYL